MFVCLSSSFKYNVRLFKDCLKYIAITHCAIDTRKYTEKITQYFKHRNLLQLVSNTVNVLTIRIAIPFTGMYLLEQLL